VNWPGSLRGDFTDVDVRLEQDKDRVQVLDRLLKVADESLMLLQLPVQLGAFTDEGVKGDRVLGAERDDRTCHALNIKTRLLTVSSVKVCLLPIAAPPACRTGWKRAGWF